MNPVSMLDYKDRYMLSSLTFRIRIFLAVLF